MYYKRIKTEVNPKEQKISYFYWVEENPPEDKEPDHVLHVTLADYIKMYNLGARGICPECIAQGVLHWLYEIKHFNGIAPLPVAVIYKCRYCTTHFNGLYYYQQ